MDKPIISNEMLYYTGEKKRYSNFSGVADSFNTEQRFEFLKHYQKAAVKWYDDESLDKKAVSDEEIYDFLRSYELPTTKQRKEIKFDKMTAYAVQKAEEYKNLQLYCGAQIKENEIVFPEKNVRPNACAKYDLPLYKDDLSISFNIFVSENYKCQFDKHVGVEQPGHSIELRAGTIEKVKLKIYNTGEVCVLAENMWEYNYIPLGKLFFGQYNLIEIHVENEKASIKLNESEIVTDISCTTKGTADSLFFDGGMHPKGFWKIKDLKINNESVKFSKKPLTKVDLQNGYEVSLPYAIGGKDNADKQIYLVKKFNIDTFKNAVLNLQTLNPCGKVWINDILVVDTQNFIRQEVCVNHALKQGENELKILVEPRAPEVYYYWHRHSDCYNGWYCGRAALILTNEVYIKSAVVKTLSVSDGVKFNVSACLNSDFCGKIKIYLQKSFPNKEAESHVATFEMHGKFVSCDISGNFELWDDENPNLYVVRCELCDADGKKTDDYSIETGFRTIRQCDGAIYLNDKKVMLNGALLMQFLPPIKDVPINHNCPSTEQIAMQALMHKKMNGSLMRIHILGYGTDDERYAQICDRLGVMLVWVTGLIDSVEALVWDGEWSEQKYYQKQMREVINNPSVIMWEGSNEYHPQNLSVIDKMFDEYVNTVKEVDTTRLICPCSHLYYGGGLYDLGCKYYNDNGTLNQDGENVQSSFGWKDSNVIRSAHTYDLLLGYGSDWNKMSTQDWKWQKELLESKNHAYLVTEFAITALPNPNTAEALENEYVESYERPNELPVFDRVFEQAEWKESQAYQALCAFTAVKKMRQSDVDGMLWCCLSSGANNGSYMKPPIDFYGYKKLGFYALKDSYRKIYACKSDTFVSYGTEDELEPMILNSSKNGRYDLTVEINDEDGNLIDKRIYENVFVESSCTVKKLSPFKPAWKEKGYYSVQHILTKVNEL